MKVKMKSWWILAICLCWCAHVDGFEMWLEPDVEVIHLNDNQTLALICHMRYNSSERYYTNFMHTTTIPINVPVGCGDGPDAMLVQYQTTGCTAEDEYSQYVVVIHGKEELNGTYVHCQAANSTGSTLPHSIVKSHPVLLIYENHISTTFEVAPTDPIGLTTTPTIQSTISTNGYSELPQPNIIANPHNQDGVDSNNTTGILVAAVFGSLFTLSLGILVVTCLLLISTRHKLKSRINHEKEEGRGDSTQHSTAQLCEQSGN